MKKLSFMLSLTLLTALALVAAVTAQEPATRPQQQEPAAKPQHQGKVVTVDTTKNELAVKSDKGKEMTLRISSTTKIMRDGKEIALADVKTGDSVLVEMEGAEENMTAKSVTILPRKAG